VRAILSVIIGAMLLGACAAKPTATSTSAASAQENKNSAAISDNLNTIAWENSPEFAASEDYERAVADYNNCVLEHTANLGACEKQKAIMNGLGKVSSRLPLRQTHQIMPRVSPTSNNAGFTQGANNANTTQQTLSQAPARIPLTPKDSSSQTPATIAPQTSSRTPGPMSLAPPTTSSPSAQISPPTRETVVDHPETVNTPSSDRPMRF
jgi:PBP1b-binding outer membrane lipoprotein LpoB